jgi:FkbM family methyltransferase
MGKIKDYTFTDETLRSIEFDGMRLYHPLGKGGGLGTKDFEPEFTEYLRRILTSDMTFLDIGAYFGSYVLLASPRVKHVIAIEPHPDIVKVLRETISRNGLENVTVIEQVLFSHETMGALGPRNNFQVDSNGPLKATTLDAWGLAPDVIKVDVEGAEYDVLIGGKDIIRDHRPVLLVEVHGRKIERFGYTAKQVYHLLLDWGYDLTEVGRRHESCFVVAK